MKFIVSGFLLIIFTTAGAQAGREYVLHNPEVKQESVQAAGLRATMKCASRLFRYKDDLTSVILIIPADSIVSVIDSDSAFLKVDFEGNEGFIYALHAKIIRPAAITKPAPKQDQIDFQKAAVQEESNAGIKLYSRRKAYLENKYGELIAKKLLSGKIWKGMTAEMVSDSWGSPVKIKRTIGQSSVREEWLCRNYLLYFEDNILAGWKSVK